MLNSNKNTSDSNSNSNVSSSNENTNNNQSINANRRRKRSSKRIESAIKHRKINHPKRATKNQIEKVKSNTTTRFISFDEFKATLTKHAKNFSRTIGAKPYTLVLVARGGGARINVGVMNRSPAWVYGLIQDIIPKPSQIIFKAQTSVVQYTDVLVLDDGSYSGSQLESTVQWADESVNSFNPDVKFHILIPFISNLGLKKDFFEADYKVKFYSEEALTGGYKRFVFEHKVADEHSLGERSFTLQKILQSIPPYKQNRKRPDVRLLHRAFHTKSPFTFLEIKLKGPVDKDYVYELVDKEIKRVYPTIQTEAFQRALSTIASKRLGMTVAANMRIKFPAFQKFVKEKKWKQAYQLFLGLHNPALWPFIRSVLEREVGKKNTRTVRMLMHMQMFKSSM